MLIIAILSVQGTQQSVVMVNSTVKSIPFSMNPEELNVKYSLSPIKESTIVWIRSIR